MVTDRMQIAARLAARLDRARREGFSRTAGGLIGLCASAAVWLMLLPLSLLLHGVGFRRLTVLTGRIGHLAAEPDSFLKARALGRVGGGRYFMLAPPHLVANQAMLNYWRPHIYVIERPWLCWIIAAMSRWLVMRHDMSRYVLRLGASQEIYRINAAWAGRKPLLELTESDRQRAAQAFRDLGLPADAWFVCVHVREPGFSPVDEDAHAYRNSDPTAVLPAMHEIVRRGGWCVRMGDPSMTPLPPLPGVIDYANHPLRSAHLDVLLCASARFFLGNTSGLTLVSSVFGVPSALANLVPLAVLPFLSGDLGIPKLLRSCRDGRILSFPEIMHSPIADFRYTRQFVSAGLEVMENTAEEIEELAVEMLEQLEGRSTVAGHEDLQNRFMALLRPGHYGYGSAARIGGMFLHRHRTLLAEN